MPRDSSLFELAGNFPFVDAAFLDADGSATVFVDADAEESPGRLDDEAAADRVASCFGRGATSLMRLSLLT